MTDGPRMRKQKLTRFSQLSKITTRRRGCTDFHPKGHMSEYSSSSEYSKPGRDPHDLPAPGSHLYGVQNKSGLTRPRDAAALTQVIQSNPANPGDPHLMWITHMAGSSQSQHFFANILKIIRNSINLRVWANFWPNGNLTFECGNTQILSKKNFIKFLLQVKKWQWLQNSKKTSYSKKMLWLGGTCHMRHTRDIPEI